MTTLVAMDLDQTLIYSARSILRAGGTSEGLVCVELRDGVQQSFMTSGALAGVEQLSVTTTFVPSTTRTREQYERVDLGVRPSFAVVANGAELLVDGRPDDAWAARTSELLAADVLSPYAVAEHLGEVLAPAWTKRIIIAQAAFAMAVVQREHVPVGLIEELNGWALERGFDVSVQGRKIYMIPGWLSKQAAIEEVRRRVGASSVLSAGDSVLDIGLLRMADGAVRPAHGELQDIQWEHHGVDVTAASGVVAGEEIVGWFLERSGQLLRRRRSALPRR